jgi:hypothetical protein
MQLEDSRSAFGKWLVTLPDESIDRLRTINTSTGSSRHIILTLAFGVYDKHIGKLNRIITSLLIARLRAERAGKTSLVERINDFMHDIHHEVDVLTGTAANVRNRENVCGRAPFDPYRTRQREQWLSS